MSVADELALLSAPALRGRLEAGDVSPVDVMEAALDRVERYNGRLNAVVTLSPRAMDDARDLESKFQGVGTDALPPLYGLPVGIKDVTPVAGLRTTFGSKLYAEHIPDEDALVVSRLRAAGAVILGKTNTPEFAAGGHTFNDVFGVTRNPWNPERSPGGSTGGGAVGLATGMIALAEGTDLGGSLRIPASFCGVVGIRPSPGLVPTVPSDYLWDDLQVTGPMARTAEGAALMLDAVSGPSPLCPIHHGVVEPNRAATVRAADLRGRRLAYCPDIIGIGVDPAVERVCREAAFALRERGAHVEELEIDLSYGRDAFLHLRGHWMAAHHHKHLDRLDQLGPNVAGNIRAGLELSTEQLAWAEGARGRIWSFFGDFHEKFDHLLTPSMAVPPFPVEQNYPATVAGKTMKTYVDWIAPTFVLSLASLPVASVPCGLDPERLPVGMQIVGRPLAEGAVLALASVIQQDHPIGQPPLSELE